MVKGVARAVLERSDLAVGLSARRLPGTWIPNPTKCGVCTDGPVARSGRAADSRFGGDRCGRPEPGAAARDPIVIAPSHRAGRTDPGVRDFFLAAISQMAERVRFLAAIWPPPI